MDCGTPESRKGRPTRLARSDCYTCLAKRRKCDRIRPHCEKCRQLGQECGGFSIQLSWQPGFSTNKKPLKRSIVRKSRRRTYGDSRDAPQFEFISEYPAHTHTDIPSALDTTSPQTPLEPIRDAEVHLSWKSPTTLQFASLVEQDRSDRESITVQSIPLPNRSNRSTGLQLRLLPDEDAIETDTADDIIGFSHDTPSLSLATHPLELAYSDTIELPKRSFYTLPPGILYDGCFQRFESIFRRYNHEFSVIPLTLNLPMNPFRCLTQVLRQSTYLQHAVLALACHHIENSNSDDSASELSKPVFDHGQTALHLLRQTLSGQNIAQMSSSLLDTIMTLFSLDEAYSLLGNWTAHLTGAYSILEISGGVEVWIKNPRTVVQVALLVWWDAVLSLVNRTTCVFPYEYLEAVLACCDDRLWTFFGLCGCPQSLVVLLVQTAHLAAEKRKSAAMRSVTFDNSLILEIEQSLEAWTHIPSETEYCDEESMHQDTDCMHCSEAWRNGLLLYIYRVFWWKSGEEPPMKVLSRARAILDHVCACRDDQFLARQALLPLFFAGCEMSDTFAQNKIRTLCSLWNERTRYHMFAGMVPLLEEVWAAKTTFGSGHVWWGQIVDKKCLAESQHSLQMRICFG